MPRAAVFFPLLLPHSGTFRHRATGAPVALPPHLPEFHTPSVCYSKCDRSTRVFVPLHTLVPAPASTRHKSSEPINIRPTSYELQNHFTLYSKRWIGEPISSLGHRTLSHQYSTFTFSFGYMR